MIDTAQSLGIGAQAPDFQNLPGVDGQAYALSTFADKPVLVVMFTCNGCPTVKANEHRMMAIQERYADQGVQLLAINSNNPYLSPADTFAEMERRATEKHFNFPYVQDEHGSVARSYGAISTPHVFVFDQQRRLCYKGRIDETRDPARATYSDLEHALGDLLAHRPVRIPETNPFGCAIVR